MWSLGWSVCRSVTQWTVEMPFRLKSFQLSGKKNRNCQSSRVFNAREWSNDAIILMFQHLLIMIILLFMIILLIIWYVNHDDYRKGPEILVGG